MTWLSGGAAAYSGPWRPPVRCDGGHFVFFGWAMLSSHRLHGQQCNSLILKGVIVGPCWLWRLTGERGRREKRRGGERNVARGGRRAAGCGSPQESPSEHAGARKKKPQPRTVEVSLLVGRRLPNNIRKLLMNHINTNRNFASYPQSYPTEGPLPLPILRFPDHGECRRTLLVARLWCNIIQGKQRQTIWDFSGRP